MPDSPDDFDFATVEELDPEPAAGGRPVHVREFLLGVVLLLCVLGWAGWQWWGQERLATSYRLAQQAAIGWNWDEAFDRYTDASGYRDADARAAEAARLISERDHNYELALAYASRGDPARELQRLQEVERVNPGFKDAAKMAAEARSEVYRQALQGSIAVRTDASGRTGLYYRSANGWTWLEGSDAWSWVRHVDLGAGRYVVYDVPEPDRSASSGGSGLGDTASDMPSLKDRRLVAASVGGDHLSFTPIGLDMTYEFYLASSHGIWGIRRSQQKLTAQQERLVDGGFPGYEFGYQPLGDNPSVIPPPARGLNLPGPDWVVIDLFSDSGKILLAQVAASDAVSATSRLYVANADGTNPQLAYSFTGQLRSAQLSPDARYILMTTDGPFRNNLFGRQTVYLLDLAAGGRNGLAAKILTPGRVWQHEPWMGGAFLRSGPDAGKILLGEWDSEYMTFAIVDPARPDERPFKITFEGNPFGTGNPLGLMWEGHESDGLLLVWPNAWRGPSTGGNKMNIIRIKDTGDWYSLSELPLESKERVAGAWVRGSSLVYGSTGRASEHAANAVYGLPLSALDAQNLKPTLVYTGTVLDPGDPTLRASSWSTGPGMLAYSDGRNLHARTYDGKVDLLLENGVTGFYAFSVYDRMHWLR
jgi:hypothetical protein